MAKEIYKVKEFNRESIDTLFSDSREDKFLSVWSPREVELLSEISPLTVKRINESTGSNYNIKLENLKEQAETIASFLTFSIDNSVFKGIMHPNIVKSKVRNLEKVYEAKEEKCPIFYEDVTDENYLDFAYFTKKLALDNLKRYQKNLKKTKRLNPQKELSFTKFFSDLFEGDLERIIQYGSSVNGGGKDIDLIILLRKINRKTYDTIRGRRKDVPSEKPVGIVLLPSYAESNYCVSTIMEEDKLVYGKPSNFPILTEEESIKKGYFKAGKELTSLRGVLGDNSRLKALTKSSEFLRETLKLEVWIRKALLQQKLGKYFSKEEFLKLETIPLVDLGKSPSVSEVKNLLYDVNCRVKDKIEEYISIKN